MGIPSSTTRNRAAATPAALRQGPQPVNQIIQRQQAAGGERAAAVRDDHERIGGRNVGPPGRQREQHAVLVVQMDPVLTPVMAVRDELEVPADQWNRCVTSTRRYRSSGQGVVDDVIQMRTPNGSCSTARTEVTDRMLIFGERHLRTVLAQYAAHYKGRRPHRSRQLHPPRPDHPGADLSQQWMKRRPVLGGLDGEYERAA